VRGKQRELFRTLGTAVIYALLPVALYQFRSLDDNSLVSWTRVFRHADALRVYLFSLLALPIACGLSRFRLPGPAVLFVISFMLGCVFWGIPEVVVDASRYFTQAKHLKVYGIGYFLSEWGGAIHPWTDLPLMPFLYGLSFKVFGENRWALQLVNTVMFAGTVSLTALIGRELFREEFPGASGSDGRIVGDTAGVLLLAMPYLYTQVPLVLVDLGSMFFLTLSTWLFLLAMRRGGIYVPLAAMAVVFVLSAKYSLWLMLSLHVMMFLVCAREKPAETLRRGGFTGILSAAFAGVLFLLYQDVVMEQIRLLMEFQKPALEKWGEDFTSTFLFQMHPVIVFGMALSVFVAMRKLDPRYIVVAWLTLLMVGLMEVRRIRYLLPAFPFVALMASYGMQAIRDERLRRFMVTAAVLMSLVFAVFGYARFLNVNNLVNLREAAKYLDGLEAGDVRVVTLSQKSKINPAVAVPVLDLYLKKPLCYDYIFQTHLSTEEIARSSFRFSWEYRNPAYYEKALIEESESGDVTAVISPAEPEEGLPWLEGHEPVRTFTISERLYRFKPYVYVYKKH
jgi:hypothetical protein